MIINTLALLSIIFAVYSVSSSHRPHYALVYLIGTFISVSLVLILSGVVFVGISYLIVYVGAILVLFLFVVLLMDIAANTDPLLMNDEIMSIRAIGIFTILLVVTYLSTIFTNSFEFISTSNDSILYNIGYSPDTSVYIINQMQSLAQIIYAGAGNPLVPIIALILILAMLMTLFNTNKKIK